MDPLNKKLGFSLIEVMVALVILSIGLLGIAKFQGKLVRTSGESKDRTEAVTLAEQKIDDLKRFDGVIDDGIATFLITTIGDNIGGDIPSGDADGDGYALSWTVTNCYYGATVVNANACLSGYGEEDADNDPPSSFSLTSDAWYKTLAVTVDWDGASGSESVTLNSILDAKAAISSSLPPTDGDSSSAGGNNLATTDELGDEFELDVDEGIEADTGDDTFRQTDKPLPDVVTSGQDANTVVKFDVLSYTKTDDPSLVNVVLRDSYQTMDCFCDYSGATGKALPPGHVRWNDSASYRYDYVGEAITKPIATASASNSNDAMPLCEVCCRDHHDDALSPVKYSVNAGVSGDHVHYSSDGSGLPVVAGGEYFESCRFKRIDGGLRVFQDWDLKDITVMRESDIDSGGPLVTAYGSYIGDFVLNQVTGSAIDDPKPVDRTPVDTTVGAQEQLVSRGIYIDKVYDDAGDESTAYTDYVSDSTNTDRLFQIPFAEVNLTLLSLWESDTSTNVSVTSEDVATIVDPDADYYGTYSRGWMNPLVEASPAATITAKIRGDNDGLTQLEPNAVASYVNDSVVVNVGAAAGSVDITGTYSIAFPSTKTSSPSIAITGGGACTLPAAPGNTFECSVTAPWTGTITISVQVNGNASQRCIGSAAYSGTSISLDQSYAFDSIACDLY